MGDDGGDYHYNDTLGEWLDDQRIAKKQSVRKRSLSHEFRSQLQALVNEGNYSNNRTCIIKIKLLPSVFSPKFLIDKCKIWKF